jgi:hypothetical protein
MAVHNNFIASITQYYTPNLLLVSVLHQIWNSQNLITVFPKRKNNFFKFITRKMWGCLIIMHKVKQVDTYFLKTNDCEGLPSHIWLNMVNVASETVLVINEYLCTLCDMQFSTIHHTILHGSISMVTTGKWE